MTLALSGELSRSTAATERCEFVFGVSSVTQVYNALEGKVTFLNEPRPFNGESWAVSFRDPDGHTLSFYGPQ